MFLEYRTRTFGRVFQADPNDALGYGRNEMPRDLTKIKATAEELRPKHRP